MLNTSLTIKDDARDNWYRYQYMRDAGHREFVAKARQCEDYVAGIQWTSEDLQILKASGRPAMTINKLLSTVDHLVGEQLFNRSSIGFRPARGMADSAIADALTKTHMNVAQTNKLSWSRTKVFEDGIITGRGFFDIRVDMNTNFMGDIVIKRVPSELVLLDPDAQDYDPDTWLDVGRTAWISLQEIEMLYGKAKAKELEPITPGYSPYDFTDDDFVRDGTFATGAIGRSRNHLSQTYYPYGMQKFYRIFERQFFELVPANVFVDTRHGEIVPVPTPWNDERVGDFLRINQDVRVMRKQIRKIRWVTTAGPLVMHESWSPYRHLTLVPFFPHFRQGRTHGVVQHLINSQDALNKTRSQEVHVVNTSANSGWLLQDNNLVNMTDAELETRGSQSGVVIVVKDVSQIDKIKPNQIPSGLDRISYKSEEDLKNISGVSDYMTGSPREDVSGKAIRANQAAGNTNFAPLFDNLARSDNLLGHRSLSLIQTFYTETRLMHVIGTQPGQPDETITVNEVTPEGTILNDLSLGEYEVVVTSEPDRDTYEDSQFEHAMELRKELGIPLPDEFMIRYSKLRDKEDLIQAMAPKNPEEEAFQAQMARETQMAELELVRANAQEKKASALLKAVNAAANQIKAGKDDEPQIPPELIAKAKVDMLLANQEHQNTKELTNIKFMNDLSEMREQHMLDLVMARALPKPKSTPATQGT